MSESARNKRRVSSVQGTSFSYLGLGFGALPERRGAGDCISEDLEFSDPNPKCQLDHVDKTNDSKMETKNHKRQRRARVIISRSGNIDEAIESAYLPPDSSITRHSSFPSAEAFIVFRERVGEYWSPGVCIGKTTREVSLRSKHHKQNGFDESILADRQSSTCVSSPSQVRAGPLGIVH